MDKLNLQPAVYFSSLASFPGAPPGECRHFTGAVVTCFERCYAFTVGSKKVTGLRAEEVGHMIRSRYKVDQPFRFVL